YGRSRARIRSGLPDRGWWRSFLGTPRHTSYRRVASKLVFSRVAVLPQPPLLVPELMGMSTAGSRPLRAACLDAVRRLTAVSGDWVVLAPGRRRESYPDRSRGSLRGYGVDVPVSLADDEPTPS